MMRNNSHRSEPIIDQNAHRPVPSFLQRLKHSGLAVGLGALLAQGVLFMIGFGSIVKWYDNLIFLGFILGCAVLGYIFGERFIETLSLKTGALWDFFNPR